ncbi:MAG: rod shape-determining protein MreC [Verrucomicrobiota bacterium]|jgi:rod shape-determining protein MreC
MLKKSHYIILVVVVVLALALLKLPVETTGKLKLAISGLFLPLFGLSGSAHELLGEARQGLTPKRELERQIEQLRRQNQEQQILLIQDASVWAENARLRGLAGWPRQSRWNVKLGRVIGRDPANWWRSMQIDLGARDGLRTNCAVLTAAGLVGRVQSVGQTRSQVIVLGDPNLRVSAIVLTNGETGVIVASSSTPEEDGMIDLDYLSGNSAVRPGQSVVTWGAGGVFPPGIPIGKIVDLRPKEYGLWTEARVKLAVNLGALEEVWVMIP